jgi:aldose 1-epimerase
METPRPGLPSGDQFQIAHGEQRVTVVEVGGGIREYERQGRPVLDPYPADAMCDGAHGAVLIPWPNRLDGGRYTFDGEEQQVPLTEPERGNAIHGLLRWRNWRAIERSDDRVVMGTRLHPMQGWPFALDVSVAYALDDDGLMVQTTATNIGSRPCPFGSGQHPYLSPGAGARLDDCTLQFQVATRILTDPDRQLPAGREPVAASDFDFSSPRSIGHLQLDDPFTDLDRDQAGRTWVSLGCPDGGTVELWCDESYTVLQLYTGDTLAPDRRRQGLAAEPMTCPPNALASGDGVIRLGPGESQVSRWGVRLR